MASPYPEGSRERNRWILAQRGEIGTGERQQLDPQRPVAYLVENERAAFGNIVSVATIFLTNRECPWRCLMCDLWQNTLTQSLRPGEIPAQIDYALSRLAPAQHIKLYNSGSFFDRKAIPRQDYTDIAARLTDFEQIIVESHPALIGEDCWQFRDLIKGRLEVSMGLETVHPLVAPRLNKGMTLEQFAESAARLRQEEVDLRVFILVKPPFLDEAEALYWAERSLDFAFDCGASVAVLIPTRPGNGALEALARSGEYSPPRLATLERATVYGIHLNRGRVFADLWNLQSFASCSQCFPERQARLHAMNLRQEVPSKVDCQFCHE